MASKHRPRAGDNHARASNVETLSDDELPNFVGRSVLDIGAWDGFYSFHAEGSGASRVVAKEVLGSSVEPVVGDRLLAFYPGNELGGVDFGNWFAPTQAGLVDMCKAAGFSRVEPRRGPPAIKAWRDHFRRNVRRTLVQYRATVLAWV